MTRTEELLALCAKENPPSQLGTTIKQLVELCRLQHEAIKIMKGRLEFSHAGNKAIAAFDKFERGE